MKNKKRVNKVISFMLAILTALSAVSPAVTTVVGALNIPAQPNGSSTYSESGEVFEDIVTGTDLDNFTISLNYGTITDQIIGDTLTVKDQMIQVPVTVNIEYRGQENYPAGAISFSMSDITNIIRTYFKKSQKPTDSNVNIGAELVGSNSGLGDWYYTKSLNDDYSFNYIFTNKAATTGAFTSSVEILMPMTVYTTVLGGGASIESLYSGYLKTFTSVLSLGENSKSSNNLYFKFNSTPYEYEISSITQKTYTYTTYSTDSSTYTSNGYKLDEYFVIPTTISFNNYYKNRIFTNNSPLDSETYGSMKLTVPDGIYLRKLDDTTDYTGTIDFKVSGGEFDNQSVTLYIPKSQYNVDDLISLTCSIEGVMFDEHEYFEDSLTQELIVKENIINVREQEINSSVSKDCYPYSSTFYDHSVRGGVDITWSIYANNNYATLYPDEPGAIITQTIFEDRNQGFCKSQNESFIDYPSIEDYYIKDFVFTNIPEDCSSTVDIYILPYGAEEYELFGIYDIISEEGLTTMTVSLNRNDVQDFKLVINGSYNKTIKFNTFLNASNSSLFNNITESFCFVNYVTANQTTADGTVFTKSAHTHHSLYNSLPELTAKHSTRYSELKNEKLVFTTSMSGELNLRNYNIDEKSIEVYSSTYSLIYPKYLSINPEDYDIYFRSNYFDLKNGENTFNQYYDKKTLPYGITIDYELKPYDENNNIIIYTINAPKDNPMSNPKKMDSNRNMYLLYMTLDNKFYMDFDIYTGLKNLGKLPASFPTVFINDPNESGSNIEEIITDLTATGDSTAFFPTIAGSTYEGVEKYVDVGNDFTKDLQVVNVSKEYSYKLRLSGGQTNVDSIILYDNLEAAHGENEYWQGEFQGLDTSLIDMYFEGEDYNYTVYYSSDRNQAFDLSSAGWIKAEEWTTELSAVKSIAVDLGEFVLPTKSIVYVVVNMIAPENSKAGVRAYNSYAADYKAYDVTTGEMLEDITALPSNITEVVFNKPIDITINKVWEGADPATDSISASLSADGKEISTFTLSAENNWAYTVSDKNAVNSTGAFIDYTVSEISEFQRFETTYEKTSDADQNITLSIINTRLPDDTYTIAKEWVIEGKEDIVLGLIEDSDLTLEDQKTLRAGNTYTVTASGEGLETVTFDATADNSGMVTIPTEYNTYTDFSFVFGPLNGKYYNANYKVGFTDPVEPESVVINTSDVTNPTITLTKEEGWKGTYTFFDSEVSFKEEPAEGWGSFVKNNGLRITFDENSQVYRTYSSYASLYVYYEYDGQIYRNSYSGDLSEDVIEIPATEFWFSLYSRSATYANYYGFKVENIENIEVETPLGSTTTALPSATPIEVSGKNYPESEHNPYQVGTTVWHYSFAEKTEDNVTVTKIGDYSYDVTIVNKGKQIANILSSDISTVEYVYDVEKEWITEGKEDIVLGLIEDTDLSLEDQKTLRANKAFTITASGDGLETITFETTADSEGMISVPQEYNAYTDFSFTLGTLNNKVYSANYKISYSDPEKPEEIVLNTSDTYNPTITLNKDNNWGGSFNLYQPDSYLVEQDLDNWETGLRGNGLAITFDENFETYSRAYLYIYYNYNGKTYRSSKYYGTGNYSLAGQTIEIPSTECWFYWYGYTSANYANYYGFKVTDIKNKQVDTTLGSSGYSIPTTVEAIEISGENYPETSHNPYELRYVLWHYVGPEKANDNITVTDNGDNTYNVKVINTGKQVANIVSADIETQKYDFNVEKEWNIVDTGSIVLGYNLDSGITEDEYKGMIAGSKLNITASGEGVETKIFEIIADTNGNIAIPDEYKGHTDFAFEVEYNNKTYLFDYKVSRAEPSKPSSITITPSVSGFDINGNSITQFNLTAANNWTTTVKFDDPTVTFEEQPVDNWTGEINVVQNGDTYTVSVANTGIYSYASTVSVDNKQFTYTINKLWNYKDIAFTLGYNSELGFTEDEYKTMTADKTFTITASGDGLTETSFEATADSNGNVIIPAAYAGFTTYIFNVVNSENVTYELNYTVSKTTPEIPNSIILYSSNGDTIKIYKYQDWTATLVSEIMNLQFAETDEILTALASYGIAEAEIETSIDIQYILMDTSGNNLGSGSINTTPTEAYGTLINMASQQGYQVQTIRGGDSGTIYSPNSPITDTRVYVQVNSSGGSGGSGTLPPVPDLEVTTRDVTYVFEGKEYTVKIGIDYEETYEEVFRDIDRKVAVYEKEHNVKVGYTVIDLYLTQQPISRYDIVDGQYLQVELETAPAFYNAYGTTGNGKVWYYDHNGDRTLIFEGTPEEAEQYYSGVLIPMDFGGEPMNGDKKEYEVFKNNTLYEYEQEYENGKWLTIGQTNTTYEGDYEYEFKPNDPAGILKQKEFLDNYDSEVTVEKVDDSNYKVTVVNTGNYIYSSTATATKKNVDVEITKEWIINEDFIKLNIKDTLGYEGNYDKVEILKGETVLESIDKSEESGLLVSKNKYPTDETYTAKIYMSDGTVKTVDINENKFELVPVEIEVFNGETSLGVFTLNAENEWKVTVSVPAGATLTIKENTTGNWTYEQVDNGIINTVNQEIDIVDVEVPVPGQVVDTGNSPINPIVLTIFSTGLLGLAISLVVGKKKKK